MSYSKRLYEASELEKAVRAVHEQYKHKLTTDQKQVYIFLVVLTIWFTFSALVYFHVFGW